MDKLKLLLFVLTVSAYATITVVHINMAQPKPVAEATLDMIEIMTRAFDESEGGEGGYPACVTTSFLSGPKYREVKGETCYGWYVDQNGKDVYVPCGYVIVCIQDENGPYPYCQTQTCMYGGGGPA